MPASPDERSNGEWKANRDFAFRNLECSKGERLPDAWQRREMVKYLRETYGDTCVVFVQHRDKRARAAPTRPQPAAPPAKAKSRSRSPAGR